MTVTDKYRRATKKEYMVFTEKIDDIIAEILWERFEASKKLESNECSPLCIASPTGNVLELILVGKEIVCWTIMWGKSKNLYFTTV